MSIEELMKPLKKWLIRTPSYTFDDDFLSLEQGSIAILNLDYDYENEEIYLEYLISEDYYEDNELIVDYMREILPKSLSNILDELTFREYETTSETTLFRNNTLTVLETIKFSEIMNE